MKSWNEMTSREQFYTTLAMGTFGGGFAAGLAGAWMKADAGNAAKLAAAFPELLERYGPGSDCYNSVAKEAA